MPSDALAGLTLNVSSADHAKYFEQMIDHCLDYIDRTRAEGRPLVGIMCEFTPRELIIAAGGVPVCLCGGSGDTATEAERVLPLNLCPLIKSTFGYHLRKSNPFLENAALVVAETTCDGKKKMFELMGESRPMYVLELPQKGDDQDALRRWEEEIRKFKLFLERKFETVISPERLRQAVLLMNRERKLRRALADLMLPDDPPITGRQLLDCKSIISGIEEDLTQYERIVSAGAEHMTKEPSGGNTSRRVRVLLTGVPVVHGAERVVDLLENAGGLVVAMENCTGLKPILEDIDPDAPDLLGAIARKYYHLPCSVLTPNQRRFDSLKQLARKFRAECVIDLVWQACITYDIESTRARQFVEEELGMPFLKIVTDYSPGDSTRISARVEALYEMVRSSR